ncbi:hypothetical protein SAMN02745192_1463 [Xylanibacter ruminicola]|nr:hypothetical protein SAMN02745192_1463 [Xylanibacter ruminicola]
MKIKKDPLPISKMNSQFFMLQFIQPGYTQELSSTTNWMKLWRNITLELNMQIKKLFIMKKKSIILCVYKNNNYLCHKNNCLCNLK